MSDLEGEAAHPPREAGSQIPRSSAAPRSKKRKRIIDEDEEPRKRNQSSSTLQESDVAALVRCSKNADGGIFDAFEIQTALDSFNAASSSRAPCPGLWTGSFEFNCFKLSSYLSLSTSGSLMVKKMGHVIQSGTASSNAFVTQPDLSTLLHVALTSSTSEPPQSANPLLERPQSVGRA